MGIAILANIVTNLQVLKLYPVLRYFNFLTSKLYTQAHKQAVNID